jgi:SagB-type dehydrogenase family enzyme
LLGLSRVQSAIARLFSALRGAGELLERGVVEAARRLDVAAIYHYASMITRRAYVDHPRPSWPGFFKPCRGEEYELPKPLDVSGTDALEAIRRRRSRREYSPRPLSLREVSTLLYYSVGVTGWEFDWPLRAYPSAGGLQPVEAYLVAEAVEGLEPGIYHYQARSHRLCRVKQGSFLRLLADVCLGQDHVAEAPAAFVFTVYYQRTASKYHARGYRYALLDAGGVMENLYIAAEALGLATVAVGAFFDEDLCELLGIDCYNEFPVLVMPVGRRP